MHVRVSDGREENVQLDQYEQGVLEISAVLVVIDFGWMSLPRFEFAVKTIDKINVSREEMVEAVKEKITLKIFHSQGNTSFNGKFDQVKLGYYYSKYLLDPNRYRFR